MKKAFTLAEIMIVLSVIAVLAAIMLPAARNLIPDDNVMKFKKAHNAFYTAVRELASSEKYHFEGDLGKRPDESLIDGTHAGDKTYFCDSLASIMQVKSVSCSDAQVRTEDYIRVDIGVETGGTTTAMATAKGKFDTACKNTASSVEAEITLNDGVVIYQAAPDVPFGINWKTRVALTNASYANTYCAQAANQNRCNNGRTFSGPDFVWNPDASTGFDRTYKVVCIDIDGVGNGEDPFGYGIRGDGKIVGGARADLWLAKSIQNED